MSKTGRTTGALLTSGFVAALLLAAPAGAQDGGPYGSTTTTTAPPRRATIELTVETGPPGTVVGVVACGYEPGAVGGSITFDGVEVAAGLIANGDGCLTGTGNAPPGDAPVTIRVPDDARPGNRNVCSSLTGYNTPCARFRVDNGNGNGNGNGHGGSGAQVQGSELERARSGGSGFLPRTGAAIALLLLVAVGLLVIGRLVLDASRRRADRQP